ncbi:Winged helix-turn-helix DNA-binding protein [Candidatus Gugararchaeum adminiculabundum]|nr:Winged helix-turn-helix DNA-binding protein [Candidatus Gugararchaeum adminiculabundum]
MRKREAAERRLRETIDEWKVKGQGLITLKKLAKKANMSPSTIKKKFKEKPGLRRKAENKGYGNLRRGRAKKLGKIVREWDVEKQGQITLNKLIGKTKAYPGLIKKRLSERPGIMRMAKKKGYGDRGWKSRKRLEKHVTEWDVEKQGRMSPRKLRRKTGLNSSAMCRIFKKNPGLKKLADKKGYGKPAWKKREKLAKIVKEWDVEKQGQMTLKKLIRKTGLSNSTIADVFRENPALRKLAKENGGYGVQSWKNRRKITKALEEWDREKQGDLKIKRLAEKIGVSSTVILKIIEKDKKLKKLAKEKGYAPMEKLKGNTYSAVKEAIENWDLKLGRITLRRLAKKAGRSNVTVRKLFEEKPQLKKKAEKFGYGDSKFEEKLIAKALGKWDVETQGPATPEALEGPTGLGAEIIKQNLEHRSKLKKLFKEKSGVKTLKQHVEEILEKWDVETQGRVTLGKLAELTGQPDQTELTMRNRIAKMFEKNPGVKEKAQGLGYGGKTWGKKENELPLLDDGKMGVLRSARNEAKFVPPGEVAGVKMVQPRGKTGIDVKDSRIKR